jgi:hypothetical protein
MSCSRYCPAFGRERRAADVTPSSSLPVGLTVELSRLHRLATPLPGYGARCMQRSLNSQCTWWRVYAPQRSDQVKRTKAANEAVRKEVEVLAAQIAEGIAQYKTTEVATALELDEVAALDACAADLATAPDSAASGRAQEVRARVRVG